jgi:hypothetical protein
MMRKPRLSKAQLRLMDEHAPAFMAWLEATGQSIGIKIEPWQKRVVEAMVRKGLLTDDGGITETGQDAYKRATEKAVAVAKRNGAKIHPRVDTIKGRTASLVIIDDLP